LSGYDLTDHLVQISPVTSDDAIDQVAFAIPKHPLDTVTKKWRVLPGAPRAFVDEGVVGRSARLKTHLVENIAQGRYWDDLDLPPDGIQELKEYYGVGGRGAAAISCCTFPLLNSSGKVCAVLNIHCDSPSWLNGTGERQSNFSMLALPIVGEIGNVFELIQEGLIKEDQSS
jgi:hypothetical protein